MQKKGITQLLWFLMGVILSAIVIIVIVDIGDSIAGLIRWEKNDDNSFNELVDAIEFGIKSGENQQVIYYVSKNHFLVGFDKNEDEARINSVSVKMPEVECAKETCICKCNLNEGDISYYSCLKDAKCSRFNSIEKIGGIVLLKEGSDAKQGGLLIKGRNQLPLNLWVEGKILKITMPNK